MRRVVTVAVAVLALCAGLQAQSTGQSGQAPTPPAKTETKAAPTVVGKWNFAAETQNGAQTSVLELKAGEGKKVSGTLTSQMGVAPIAGEFADGKLALKMTYDSANGSIELIITGTMKEDGTLTGSLDFAGQGIPWHAERVKEK